MGKSRRGEKEYSKEQRLVKENKQLKQQVAQLRKQLARLDLDRYSSVKEIIDEQYEEDKKFDQADLLDKLKKEWKCRDCDEGHLEIVIYNKIDTTWYFRKCSDCSNRTKSQKYDSKQVKGIGKK
jgi:cell division septum initiation protein DivIVA